MYSCGPPHMDVQEWDDQHEHTYSNYVRTQDVTLKTCQRRWMIGRNGERGSRISALTARHDDDMPPGARSRLCSRDSAWAGVFARSAMSSAYSESEIVCARYLLLLSFASSKPFSFIKSIESVEFLKVFVQ